MNDVRTTATSSNNLTEDAFFEIFTGHIIDAGDLETADRCYFRSRGVRIDGYAGDPIDSENILTVMFLILMIILIWLKLIGRKFLKSAKSVNFISNCLSTRFFNELDEYSDEYGLADLIRSRWESILKIRILFITTRLLKIRSSKFEPIPVNGKTAIFSCWDIARLSNFVQSNKNEEPISVNLIEHGSSLSVLPAHNADTSIRSYLCVMPGKVLGSIYDEYGTKLLEKNVRVFCKPKARLIKVFVQQ